MFTFLTYIINTTHVIMHSKHPKETCVVTVKIMEVINWPVISGSSHNTLYYNVLWEKPEMTGQFITCNIFVLIGS